MLLLLLAALRWGRHHTHGAAAQASGGRRRAHRGAAAPSAPAATPIRKRAGLLLLRLRLELLLPTNRARCWSPHACWGRARPLPALLLLLLPKRGPAERTCRRGSRGLQWLRLHQGLRGPTRSAGLHHLRAALLLERRRGLLQRGLLRHRASPRRPATKERGSPASLLLRLRHLLLLLWLLLLGAPGRSPKGHALALPTQLLRRQATHLPRHRLLLRGEEWAGSGAAQLLLLLRLKRRGSITPHWGRAHHRTRCACRRRHHADALLRHRLLLLLLLLLWEAAAGAKPTWLGHRAPRRPHGHPLRSGKGARHSTSCRARYSRRH